MAIKGKWVLTYILTGVLVAGCASIFKAKADVQVDHGSVQPGESITKKGKPLRLIGTPLVKGEKIPGVNLTDAATMKTVDLSQMTGSVLILSVVPSIDTKVCDAQTHYLGEEGDRLSPGISRITISRDTPFAQKRFAEAAKLTDVRYLSDYKQADFGRASGLLVENVMLLARSVILVDKNGVVRYIQVVPEITHLPDMEAAFKKAEELLQEK
jgi:thiol peroxidase